MTRYFAYGSNLVTERMHERGAAFAAARPAVLRDHQLRFDKAGRDGTARANVGRAVGGQVFGVVYDLRREGLEALKLYEVGYDLAEVLVECPRPDGGVEVVTARTFVARPDRRTEAPPSRGYVELILEGMRQHQLPDAARADVERAAGLGPLQR
ncbi:MAG TPA: gamma-glutamylcyclotransferase family protein [Anaeromyxobacteraceae bacterium]|nr:gamma-glutamylcyclotransferase family protein [Anaeromyxobacteraceae bacterium]